MSKTIVAYQSFVGVDLHKCTVTLVSVGADGEIKKLTISTKSTGKIDDWLRLLPGPVWMAVEACPFVEWFIDRFRCCVFRIDIADATELSNRRVGDRDLHSFGPVDSVGSPREPAQALPGLPTGDCDSVRQKNGPWFAIDTRGPMHTRRTLGLAIPRQVASPQNLLPFHQTIQP